MGGCSFYVYYNVQCVKFQERTEKNAILLQKKEWIICFYSKMEAMHRQQKAVHEAVLLAKQSI